MATHNISQIVNFHYSTNGTCKCYIAYSLGIWEYLSKCIILNFTYTNGLYWFSFAVCSKQIWKSDNEQIFYFANHIAVSYIFFFSLVGKSTCITDLLVHSLFRSLTTINGFIGFSLGI